MLLQKMVHNNLSFDCDSDSVVEVVHGVAEVTCGGEYTICGLAIPDSSLEFDGFERKGEEYRGRLGLCTCGYCLKIIRYYKDLR